MDTNSAIYKLYKLYKIKRKFVKCQIKLKWFSPDINNAWCMRDKYLKNKHWVNYKYCKTYVTRLIRPSKNKQEKKMEEFK